MKRFDENDVAKRLGAQTPPPPPELAARIKRDIPEQVDVPPALTAPRGTLPLIGRLPARHRVLALAATVLVAVAAGLVARRVLLPAAGPPLEVALVESVPTTDQAAAPAPAPPEAVAFAPAAEPMARTVVAPSAHDEAGRRRQEASHEAAKPALMPAAAPSAATATGPPAAPQVAAQPTADAAVAGIEGEQAGGTAGTVLAASAREAGEERTTAQSRFVEVRAQPRFDTRGGTFAMGKAKAAGAPIETDRTEARKAGFIAPASEVEPSLAPAPLGGALLLLVPAGAVVTFEPTAVARYRPLPAPSAADTIVMELIVKERLEPSSPLLRVIIGPAAASGAAAVLRRSDVAASFREAPRSLRRAYLEGRLDDQPQARGEEAALLLTEADALAAEDPADRAAQALRSRWEAVGLPALR